MTRNKPASIKLGPQAPPPRRGRRLRKFASLKRSIRSLLSSEQFIQALDRESLRVDRGSCGDLSLVLFRVPNSRRRNALSNVRLIRTIIERVRVTDDVGWFDKRQLGVLLPDTNSAGAWALAQEICHAIAATGATKPTCTMYAYPADEKQSVSRSIEPAPRAVKVAS